MDNLEWGRKTPGAQESRSTLQNRLAVYWEFRSFKTPGAPGGTNRTSSPCLNVSNFGEFQEFYRSSSSSSQYASMTPIAILAGIINNNRKCSILILFLYPYLNICISVQDVKSPGEINNWPKSAILSVEGIPGAPWLTGDPSPKSPKIVNVY